MDKELLELNLGKSYLTPAIFFAGAAILFFTKGFSPVIAIALCLGLLFFPQAFKAARTGNRILAIKTAVSSFIPIIGSLNAAAYKIINSELVQKYIVSAKEGAELFKGVLFQLTPEYGETIYKALIWIIIIGVNFIVIEKFIKIVKKLSAIAILAVAAENLPK